MHLAAGVLVLSMIIFGFFIVESQQISSKLDFNQESKEIPTHTMKSPKIQGVRVTVDTTKIQRSAESRSDESSSSAQASDSKKKVGIRTDITFEIDDRKNDSNSTSNESGTTKEVGKDDDDDSSVPIFKGKPTPGDRKTNKNDPPKFYGDGNRRIDHNSNDHPIFHGVDDENPRHFNNNNDWSNFIPMTTIWTTERPQWNPNGQHHYNHNHYNGGGGGGGSILHRGGPNGSGYHKGFRPTGNIDQLWKMCNCNNGNPSVAFRPNDEDHLNRDHHDRNFYVDQIYPNDRYDRVDRGFQRHPGVDDKLEEPFKLDRGR